MNKKTKNKIQKINMDFETRQKKSVEEINEILKKYNVALQPFLNAQLTGIIPAVRIIDLEEKETQNVVGNNQQDNGDKKTTKSKKKN